MRWRVGPGEGVPFSLSVSLPHLFSLLSVFGNQPMGFQTKGRTIRTSPLHLLQRSCCLFFSGDVLNGLLQAVTSCTVIFFFFYQVETKRLSSTCLTKETSPCFSVFGFPFFPCLLFSTSSFFVLPVLLLFLFVLFIYFYFLFPFFDSTILLLYSILSP